MIKGSLNVFLTLLLTLFVANLFAQVQFVENKGQWDERVKFMSNAGDGSFFLEQNGFTVSQLDPIGITGIKEKIHGQTDSKLTENSKTLRNVDKGIVHAHSYSVEFLNAKNAQIFPEKPIATINNYCRHLHNTSHLSQDKSLYTLQPEKSGSQLPIYFGHFQ
jgi:hypothetical protein